MKRFHISEFIKTIIWSFPPMKRKLKKYHEEQNRLHEKWKEDDRIRMKKMAEFYDSPPRPVPSQAERKTLANCYSSGL